MPIRIKDFVEKCNGKYLISFYLNDKLVDLDILEDNEDELDYFEFECNNVVRLYSR